MARICNLGVASLLTLGLLGGCATPHRLPATRDGQTPSSWAGRMSLRVDADQSRSFSASFELKGSADAGELALYAPLGSTIAQLTWSPTDARLKANGTERSFNSLDELVKQATGAELPVGSIFQWLAGQAADAGGWQADLTGLGSGRLVARRNAPPPALELRLVLE